jgi:L-alanine-DL-glutamate epimerase-like enolase superfamily enzyme
VAVIDGYEVIPFSLPSRLGPTRGVLLKLKAGRLVGLGEAAVLQARGNDLGVVRSQLVGAAQAVVGRALADVDDAYQLLSAAVSPAVSSALESALLDLLGQSNGRSVSDLLGGPGRREVRCGALLLGDSAAAIGEEARGVIADGFGDLKLKSVDGGGPVDLERVRMLRSFSPGLTLRLDFNGLVPGEARLKELAEVGLSIAEQPLGVSDDLGAWLNLAMVSPIPVVADESLGSPILAGQLAGAKLGMAAKLATVGGGRAVVNLLAQGDLVSIGSSHESSIGLAFALHVAAALKSEPAACGLATRAFLQADLAQGLGPEGPQLRVPADPGLGVELDELALQRYRSDR